MIIPKSQFSRSYHAFLSRLEKSSVHLVFFFNDPATTEIYTLSLHDALPIPVDSSDELGQLARTFNDMQRRLAELDHARKQFIANASHELRTPIFSLGGFVELLDEEDPDPESRAEFVRTMREQVVRLTKLTGDLLNLSQLDAGGIEMKIGS